MAKDQFSPAKPAKPAGQTASRSRERSKSEYAAEGTERREFLRSLGITDRWAVATYAKNCLLAPRIADPWVAPDLEDQLVLHDDDVQKRIRSLPSFAFTQGRSRKTVGTRVKASSTLFKSILEDAEKAESAVIVQATVVARLRQRLIEEEGLLRALEHHQQAAARLEDKALNAAPRALLAASRMLENAGLDKLIEAGEGKEFAEAFGKLVDEFSQRGPGSSDLDRRLQERLAAAIDDELSGGAGHEETLRDATRSAAPASDVDADLGEPEGGRTELAPMPSWWVDAACEDGADVAPGESGDPETPASYARAQGHGRIDGLTSEDCFSGVVCAVPHGPEDREIDAAAVCMKTRPLIDLADLIGMPGGMVDPAAWTRFEVPSGRYTLQQMVGRSTRLPPFDSTVSLPPYPNLTSYGRLLGLEPSELGDLGLWDAPGDGPAHLRPHLLNGPTGDPDLAYDVMKRAVVSYYGLFQTLNGLPELKSAAVDNIARFWLFLVAGRMRPASVTDLWGDSFYDGVEGHDPVLKDTGYWLLSSSRATVGSGLVDRLETARGTG